MPSFIFQCSLRLSQWVHRRLLPDQRYVFVQTPSTVGPRKVQLVLLYLQTVVQPVRTEELVMVHTRPLTVSVPVGTQETTARTEVCNSTQPWTGTEVVEQWSIACFFIFADCSPACQNGGICRSSSSNAYCNCPSGYTGDYCQNEGIYAHAIRSIPLQASLIQSLTFCSDLYTSLSEWGNMSW